MGGRLRPTVQWLDHGPSLNLVVVDPDDRFPRRAIWREHLGLDKAREPLIRYGHHSALRADPSPPRPTKERRVDPEGEGELAGRPR